MNKKILKLNQKPYTFINERTYVPVRIYKSGQEFLRIGPKSLIKKEIALHQKLIRYGFPVPKILRLGLIDNEFYFGETSLGEKHFGSLFQADIKKLGRISDQTFSKFLKVCLKFGQAQIKVRTKNNVLSFRKGIHIPQILEELPNKKTQIKKALQQIESKTKQLPYVLTHGDFGPFNIYPKGVIDLEAFFQAPLGYDLVSAIFQTNFFPKTPDYELRQIYSFSPKQIDKYFQTIDRLFTTNKLPRLSEYLNEFILCRCIWVATRMQATPKIQQWRYRQLKNLLADYLHGADLKNELI